MPTKGNKITASDFNSLVDTYNINWSDVYSGVFVTETDKTLHGYGWGQSHVVPTVAVTDIIEAEHINTVIAQVNAGLFHIDYSHTDLMPMLATGTPVLASNVAEVQNKLYYINNNRYKVADDAVRPEIIVHDYQTDQSVEWTDTISMVASATFATYNESRYFFNSGGSIFLDLEMISLDETANGWANWNSIFESIGQIRICADRVDTDGYNLGISNGGYYNLIVGQDYTTLWQGALTGSSGGSYGSYGSYGGYGGYSGRIVTISCKLVSNSNGSVKLLFKLRLTDTTLMAGEKLGIIIGCDIGYKLPESAPASNYNNTSSSKFTVGSTEYRFEQRTPPSIQIETHWYSDQ